MTYQELNRYFCLQKKIKLLNADLTRIACLSATTNDGMPHGTSVGDPVHSTYLKIEKIREKLEFQKQRAVNEFEKLNDFIESVEDIEMQVILRMRFIDCRSYESIGNEMFMDRRTVSRKIDQFIEDAHNAHLNCDIM